MLTNYEKILLFLVIFIIVLGLISYLDSVLAVGIIFCIFLTVLAFLFFQRANIDNKKRIYLLFGIAFLIHILFVLFVYYSNFYPFSGGWDAVAYNIKAQEINRRLHQGNFSVGGEELPPLVEASNHYPVLIGYIYAFTVPSPLMGQLFNAWLVALIIVLSYLIVMEIGGGERGAFFVGLAVILYPSLLFNGSLLLKESLVVLFALISLLLTIKLIKKFNWKLFFVLYLAFIGATHLRFFLGYAVMFAFIICWFLFGSLEFKKRIRYSLIIIPILGFIPLFTTSGGYWGINAFKEYLNVPTITYYREIIYERKIVYEPQQPSKPVVVGPGSTFTVKTGLNNIFEFGKNSSISFIYALLGPFPWQIRYKRHLYTLLEIIPWYILFLFIVRGVIKIYKKNYKITSPLLLFSLIFLGGLAIFINNFGYLTRVRIPAFIALLCFAPFGIGKNNIIYKYLDKIYEKILSYGRKWFYRFKSR